MTIFVADEEYFTVQISIISSGGGVGGHWETKE